MISVSNWSEGFRQNACAAFERENKSWSDQKRLAYQLVHSAFRDPNPETRHIQLVTAIEVLIFKKDRPQPIIDALEKFIAQVEREDISPGEELEKKLIKILDSQKIESISQAGAELVAERLTGKYRKKNRKIFSFAFTICVAASPSACRETRQAKANNRRY